MIIVEGCDGSGKTTLVERLMDDFAPLHLGERATKDRNKLYLTTRQDTYTALATDLVDPVPRVWDRLFFSEFVYAPMMGREVQFNLVDEYVIRPALKQQAFIIVCHTDMDTAAQNAGKYNQMSGVLENFATIWCAYNNLARSNFVHSFNYKAHSYDLLKVMVDKHLLRRKRRTFEPYTGD